MGSWLKWIKWGIIFDLLRDLFLLEPFHPRKMSLHRCHKPQVRHHWIIQTYKVHFILNPFFQGGYTFLWLDALIIKMHELFYPFALGEVQTLDSDVALAIVQVPIHCTDMLSQNSCNCWRDSCIRWFVSIDCVFHDESETMIDGLMEDCLMTRNWSEWLDFFVTNSPCPMKAWFMMAHNITQPHCATPFLKGDRIVRAQQGPFIPSANLPNMCWALCGVLNNV